MSSPTPTRPSSARTTASSWHPRGSISSAAPAPPASASTTMAQQHTLNTYHRLFSTAAPPSTSRGSPATLPPSLSSAHRHASFPRPDSRGSAGSAPGLRPAPHSSALGAASGLGSAGQGRAAPAKPASTSWTEQWPREYQWVGVEIPVTGVSSMRHMFERAPEPAAHGGDGEDAGDLGDQQTTASDDDDSAEEVLACSFGNNRWKIEVIRDSPRSDPAALESQPSTATSALLPATRHPLSLYLTCHALEVDWPSARSVSTSIFVGIKESQRSAGNGASEEDWIWRAWVGERTFEKEREVWECHSFPSLTALLEHPKIAALDSFVLTVQIASPSTALAPQLPEASYVPQSLLSGIASLFDDPETSDVRILVAEREPLPVVSAGLDPSPPPQPRYRKRVLYAHSSMLSARSEYFRGMLGEGLWAESNGGGSRAGGGPAGSGEGRRVHTVKIEDADFVTVYWLLKWIYTDSLYFASTASDPDSLRPTPYSSSSNDLPPAGWLSAPMHNPWDWKVYVDGGGGSEAASDYSYLETASEGGPRRPAVSAANRGHGPGGATAAGKARRSTTPLLSSGTPPASGAAGKRRAGAGVEPSHGTAAPQPPGGRVSPLQSFTAAYATGQEQRGGIKRAPAESGFGGSGGGAGGTARDPHSHPVAVPGNASALALYKLAHRYRLDALAGLAMAHLIGNLTPAIAFPLLLATHVFPELHAEIKAYCLNHYHQIVKEPAFARSFAEVGEGLWDRGGEVLLSFTMSLMPPAEPSGYY